MSNIAPDIFYILWGSPRGEQQRAKMDFSNIIEIMEFKVNDGLAEADFLEATRGLMNFIIKNEKANMKLLKGKNNTWILLTTYSNENEAQEYFPELMALPLAKQWVQMIDRTSIKKNKFKVIA